MSTTNDLEVYARTMLSGFAKLLLKVPVGDLPEALHALANGSGAVIAAKPRGRAAAATIPAARPKARARKPGEKRSPDELAKLVEALRGQITQNPGQGIEAIAKTLGVKSGELQLPTQKLLANGAIRKEGQKRATKYFPGAGGSAGEAAAASGAEGAAPKKSGRKPAKKGAGKRGRKAKG
jgi:hypothetical protein